MPRLDIILDRALTLFLRITTLGTRFLFVVALAKFLAPEMVGYYGLFTATIGYALYFVGVDFYAYVTREIIRAAPDQRGGFLKGQAVLSSGLYLLTLPTALYLSAQAGWPSFLLWWFGPILLLEYLNQELSRLLIAFSCQVSASVVLFLRQGSWAIAGVALFAFFPQSRSLENLFLLWAVAGFAALALALWQLIRLEITGWRLSIDWAWVRRGLTVSLGFLVATLALRGIQTFDRYWIEALGGVETVAAYVLFTGFAGALTVFLDAGIFAFLYPALIRLAHTGDEAQARLLIRRALWQTVLGALVFSAVAWALLPYFLQWIGNPVYQAKADIFPWILAATALNAITMIPHYALYARNFDRPIIVSHIAGLLVFCAVSWGFSTQGSVLAVLIGLNTAFLLILVVKSAAYLILASPREPGSLANPSPHKVNGANP